MPHQAEGRRASARIIVSDYLELPVESIDTSSGNLRSVPDDDAQKGLEKSIDRDGQLQPGVGYRLPGSSKVVLLSGFRRLAAVMALGIATFKLLLLDHEPDEAERLLLQLTENLHRKDLSPIEEGKAYRAILDETGMSARELAERLSIAHTTVTRAVDLTELPEEYQAAIESGALSPAHGRALARVPDLDQMRDVYERIRSHAMTAAQTEKYVSGTLVPPKGGKRKAAKPTKRVYSLEGGYRAVVTPKQLLLKGRGAGAVRRPADFLPGLELLLAALRDELTPPGSETPGD